MLSQADLGTLKLLRDEICKKDEWQFFLKPKTLVLGSLPNSREAELQLNLTCTGCSFSVNPIVEINQVVGNQTDHYITFFQTSTYQAPVLKIKFEKCDLLTLKSLAETLGDRELELHIKVDKRSIGLHGMHFKAAINFIVDYQDQSLTQASPHSLNHSNQLHSST